MFHMFRCLSGSLPASVARALPSAGEEGETASLVLNPIADTSLSDMDTTTVAFPPLLHFLPELPGEK